MRRQVNRRVLLKKGKATLPRKGTSKHRSLRDSFYQRILARSGECSACVIRKVGGIGDILMITPTLRQLKADFPALKLTFAIDMHTTGNNVYYELLRNAPYIDFLIDARFVEHGSYEATIDISAVCIRFERKGLPTVNRVDLFARACGVPLLRNRRSWYVVEPQEVAYASSIYRQAKSSGKKIVFLHTASMEAKRSWPIEKYIEIVSRAEAEDLPVTFAVMDFNNKYSLWDKHSNCINISATTLREMAALISEADVFIGPDSGPMHIAGAVSTSSIVLFGSIPPQARINYYPTHEAFSLQELSCIGCWYATCPYNTKCMTDLDSDRVYAAIKKRTGL